MVFRKARASSAALAAALLTIAPLAHAVGTRVFELDTLDKLSGGDLKGVAVSSDGKVRPGFTLGNVPLRDATAVYTVLPLADGSALVGTSPNGKVLKVTGDQATVFADTQQTAVTSIVEGPGGAYYAATIPEGRIYRLDKNGGKADVFATLPEAHNVWALAYDRAQATLFAAAGTDGKVFRIGADGAPSVYFQSDEPNIVSLAIGEGGVLYAGSEGKALLYKITGPGRATVLYDFAGDEVKGIAAGKDGVLYAIANEYAEAPEVPRRNPAGARTPSGPTSAPRPKPGKGSLFRFDVSGRPERLMHHDEFHYLALAVGDDGQPYVGTGAEGRVYTVNDAHTVTLVADTDERQVGALAFSNGGNGAGAKVVIASGDPAVFHRVVARGGAEAVWTSKVLDAGLAAQFGAIEWQATGPLEISTRTGNAKTPDATWSPWSNPITQPARASSPPARFVQVRARWRDASAVLSEMRLSFLTENTRPVVTEIASQSAGLLREPVKDNTPASGSEPPKHDTVVKLTWKVDNDDNDALRYRVQFRREGQSVWRDALAPDETLTKPEYAWETDTLPEGRYRVRVEASDEDANPPGRELKHALESERVLVDNTPPQMTALTLNGRRLRLRVVDGVGPIVRVELAIDGKTDFRPLAAADGIFDTADETVDTDVAPLVPPGSHIVTVRAYDAAGNAVTREVESAR